METVRYVCWGDNLARRVELEIPVIRTSEYTRESVGWGDHVGVVYRPVVPTGWTDDFWLAGSDQEQLAQLRASRFLVADVEGGMRLHIAPR